MISWKITMISSTGDDITFHREFLTFAEAATFAYLERNKLQDAKIVSISKQGERE